MLLAPWLDVALEGGVRELERARADYRSLGALLRGDWRVRALRVAVLAERCRATRRKVDAAIERAYRRVRVDVRAAPGAELAEGVEEERELLEAAMESTRGERASLGAQLDWLCEAAKDESYYAASRASFAFERAGWTGLLGGLCVALGAAVPAWCWYVASDGGVLHTLFDPQGLEAPQVWGSFAGLLAALAVSWTRLFAWSWLGVEVPPLLQPASLSAAAGLTCAAAILSFVMFTPVPLAVTIASFTALVAWQVLAAFWRVPSPREG